jgi:hypothetical protein
MLPCTWKKEKKEKRKVISDDPAAVQLRGRRLGTLTAGLD